MAAAAKGHEQELRVALVGDVWEHLGISCKHVFIEAETPLKTTAAERVAKALYGRFISTQDNRTHIAIDGLVLGRREELAQRFGEAMAELGLQAALPENEVTWKVWQESSRDQHNQ
jgi:hypothetical protein